MTNNKEEDREKKVKWNFINKFSTDKDQPKRKKPPVMAEDWITVQNYQIPKESTRPPILKLKVQIAKEMVSKSVLLHSSLIFLLVCVCVRVCTQNYVYYEAIKHI